MTCETLMFPIAISVHDTNCASKKEEHKDSNQYFILVFVVSTATND